MSDGEDGGGKVRRFRLGRRQRSAEDPFADAGEDEVDDNWLADISGDLRDGDDEEIPSPGPPPRRSPAAAVSEAMEGLSKDISALEDRLSRLEETLSPPTP